MFDTCLSSVVSSLTIISIVKKKLVALLLFPLLHVTFSVQCLFLVMQ